ncbi:MAG: protease modulator HflC [Desulfosudaceae bacterium]
MKTSYIAVIIVAVAGLVFLFNSLFVVDETEQVVVTRFGKIARDPVVEPGLNFKWPFVDRANYFPKHLLEWDGSPGQIPTKGKTYIWVDSFARWRIVDPLAFFQTVTTVPSGINRLNDIIDPAVRNLVTSHRLIETVRKSNRPLDTFRTGEQLDNDFSISMGRREMTDAIKEQAQPKLDKFGIELADVKLKRINYVKEVRRSVYDRMIAERNQMAEKFRSEGKGEASKIRGQKEKELKKISSEAYQKAQVIQGKADATALEIYANAYQRDPELYSFLKTLEVYETSFNQDNELVLSTDTEFFKYLKSYQEKQ